MKWRLSSRQSDLAKAQAYQVGEALQKSQPGLEIEYLFRESLGDKNLTDPLWKMPEKGVFTEDFYQDLVQERTEMVVHSWKDLPTEGKSDTRIVATLPRADQRDLLLFKKSHFGKSTVRLFSSSPRRALNLKEFLSEALPWSTSSIEFQSVRGNIQTRVRKLLEDPEVDGLVLAKAALDRLLVEDRFAPTQIFLRQALSQLQWMVLPLSENPNAAAQGALAIEVASHRGDVIEKLQSLNCQESFQAAQREREILQEFGGGCHLALGMSVLHRPYGRLEIVKGQTPQGKKIQSKKFFPRKALPVLWKRGQLEFSSERQAQQTLSLQGFPALFVAKSEAWPAGFQTSSQIVWTAGLQTWRKLARAGVWVHGSAEGLGESEDPRIDILAGEKLIWGRVTHDQATQSHDKTRIGSYHLQLTLLSSELGSADVLRWRSASEFRLALQRFPEIRQRRHLCGPGRTYETLHELLGSDENLYVELSDEFITVV